MVAQRWRDFVRLARPRGGSPVECFGPAAAAALESPDPAQRGNFAAHWRIPADVVETHVLELAVEDPSVRAVVLQWLRKGAPDNGANL